MYLGYQNIAAKLLDWEDHFFPGNTIAAAIYVEQALQQGLWSCSLSSAQFNIGIKLYILQGVSEKTPIRV